VDDGARVEPLDDPRATAERELLIQLQRAMLPAGLPVFPELSVAAEYRPADRPNPLGGDWFDVVPTPDEALGLVVGDAVGHGAAAVAVMGQLGAVVTERLRVGSDLHEVMLALDTYAAASPSARGATVCVAILDRRTGAVRYGVRGHPPPLVVGADGRTRYLTASTGPPLALLGDRPRLATDTLRPGETLVLYTDGLIERPHRTLDQGLGELAACVADAVRRNRSRQRDLAEDICSAAASLAGAEGDRHDDVSVVAATVLAAPPEPMTMTVRAVPDQLGVVRRHFSGWLHEFRAGGDDVVALELSVVEAVTNSIEHAFNGMPGTVHVSAALRHDGVVEVVVDDNGRWKPPAEDPGFRGRGLVMMREFSDELLLRATEHGTTVEIAKALHRPAFLDDGIASRTDRVGSAEFGIDVRFGSGEVIVSVSGVVDSSNVDRLQAGLLDAGRRGLLPLTVVLDEVSLLASAGLRTLYEHAGTLLAAGRSIRLVAADNSPARGVLAVSGLDKVVEVVPRLG
jgi:anti-anti-sigma factor